MKEYKIFREKARSLRNNHKSLNEICETLKLNKSTVFGWIKDIEVEIEKKSLPGPTAAGIKTRNMWAERRQQYYNQGLEEYKYLVKNKKFRDFIILYICEGYKRCRNAVNITNSDPIIIKVAYDIMKTLTNKKARFGVQVHLDNDFHEVKIFWSKLLDINKDEIKVYPRKISMTSRNGRLQYGIFQVLYNDTQFRSRIQAWIDCVKKEWSA